MNSVPDIWAPDLTLTIAESQASNRWYLEQEKLRYYPTFTLLRGGGTIAGAEGTLNTQNGNTYAIRIELKNYPFEKPTVRPKDWTIHPKSPHYFSDGSICIMRADQWRRIYTVALVVAKTALWLGKYEIWKREQYWPGLGQSHEP